MKSILMRFCIKNWKHFWIQYQFDQNVLTNTKIKNKRYDIWKSMHFIKFNVTDRLKNSSKELKMLIQIFVPGSVVRDTKIEQP